MSLGCGSIPGEGALGRQGFCVREYSAPPRSELAAVVTRSHPAMARISNPVRPGQASDIENGDIKDPTPSLQYKAKSSRILQRSMRLQWQTASLRTAPHIA